MHSVKNNFWTEYLDKNNLNEPKIINLKKHFFTQKLIEQIEYLQEHTNFEIPASTSMTMSPLIVFTNLFDSSFAFTYMIDYPEKVKNFTNVIKKLIIELDNYLTAIIKTEKGINTRHTFNWAPPYYCTLYGCTLNLVSRELYDDLFLPYDLEILNNYIAGGIHLSGKTNHLVETFKKIEKLVFIQLNREPVKTLKNFIVI